ncbi:unnamed protein product [Lactuca virosa]|uniref:RRM domain-containing protein n=1 Tax=Lactuca virosa TaxID=75947 RepID=A0AAU9MKD5_9ASTR|nr:unnamed protein product [Lactuca virosa]
MDTDLTNTTVYIDNLDLGVAEEGLRSIFLQFGQIVYVKILAAKGCRFVQFVNRKLKSGVFAHLRSNLWSKSMKFIKGGI